MYRLKKPNISSLEIAGYLNSKLVGEDNIINIPSSINNIQNNSFFFMLDNDILPEQVLKEHKDILILTSKDLDNDAMHYSYVKTDNPKLDYIKVINEFFIEFDLTRIASSSKININATIGRNVSVGENSVIGPDVIIGNNTQILNNVVITSRVEIGRNCIIKNNSTIGSEGYDFEFDENGNPINFPHIGKIFIGNNVWIGANTSIESAKIESTVINDFVKIDDLVQIGYNCKIGSRCLITAGVIISRNVTISYKSLIAPNATIRENITIGRNVIVGDGSVVVKNIEDDTVYVGNPAHFLKYSNKGE